LEPDDAPVHPDVRAADGLAEDDALKARAAAEGHVDLSVGERPPPDVDDDPVEGLALALVDRDRPGQLERVLGERADGLGHDFAGLPVEGEPENLPDVGPDLNLPAVGELDLDHIILARGFEDLQDPADRTVDPAP
jgi:hypothetical protein